MLVHGGAAPGHPTLRVHDLRHTAASIWLGQGAAPKLAQAVLGHTTAAMTTDLDGHLVASNLWDAAGRIGTARGLGHRARRPYKPTPPSWRDEGGADLQLLAGRLSESNR